MRLRWFVIGAAAAVLVLAVADAVLENLELPSPIAPPPEETPPF